MVFLEPPTALPIMLDNVVQDDIHYRIYRTPGPLYARVMLAAAST